MTARKVITLKVSHELKTRLSQTSRRLGIYPSELARVAIATFIDQIETGEQEIEKTANDEVRE